RKIKNWKQGFKVKFSSNWKRINHDLHNSLGLYAFVFLFLMGITGPQWSFEWYRTGLRKTLGTYEEPSKPNISTQASGKQSPNKDNKKDQEEDSIIQFLPLDKYIASASSALKYNGDYRISLP